MVNSKVYSSRQVEPDFAFLPDRVNDILRQKDRVVLLMYSRYSDRWKGTGLFIKAFSNAAKKHPERFFLITSGWGEDAHKYLELILSDTTLKECVYCMEGAVSKGYLRMLLNSVDVAVDQFLLGWYGSTFVEAAACGRMVLINLDRDRWDEYVEMEFPPVRDCSSAERIEEVLEALAKGEIDPRREGMDFERWIQRNHGMEKLVPRLLGLVEERL
jgi:glycosyltransferase involved in cell wall biosynthesis